MAIQPTFNLLYLSLHHKESAKVQETIQEDRTEAVPAFQTAQHDEKAFQEAKQAELTRKLLEEKYQQKLLSKELAESTSGLHRLVVLNVFLNKLIKGEFHANDYLQYLCCLYVIHQALEEVQKQIILHYGKECFVFEELFRSEKIFKDIRAWAQVSESTQVEIESFVKQPAKEMVVHLKELVKENALYAVGILYALYGGLMSGGQIIKAGVEKKYLSLVGDKHQAASEDFGVSLYTFPFDIKEYKITWHQNLDQVPNQTGFNRGSSFMERLQTEAQLAFMNELEFIKYIDNT
jgi:heme oxygenase